MSILSDAAGPAELTTAGQARMLALASQALAKVPSAHVPAPLRKSAQFAPAKRAKLIGVQVVDLLEADDEFREHLAVQVRAIVPDLAQTVDAGDPSVVPAAELDDAAAVAFLLRPARWSEFAEAATQAAMERRVAPGGELARTVERLAEQVDQAKRDNQQVREKSRRQVDELKAQNTQLRRTLGDTRTALKQARTDIERMQADAVDAGQQADKGLRAADAELRRLRARITELESDNSAAKRALRDDRDAEVMRLRLLLETIIEAAGGLRRELALPPSELLPADTVAAIEPLAADVSWGASRALLDDDPALLRRLLDMPRVHLIVDGYNVSKSAWPSLPLDQQRARLVQGVNGVTAGKSAEVSVVFDGADLINPPPVSSPRGIRVRFSPPGVIADDLIRRIVEAEPVGRPIIVVSTDRELARSVVKKGARSVASAALIGLLGAPGQ
jgi:predicted RNA-binding protein with PIN domain